MVVDDDAPASHLEARFGRGLGEAAAGQPQSVAARREGDDFVTNEGGVEYGAFADREVAGVGEVGEEEMRGQDSPSDRRGVGGPGTAHPQQQRRPRGARIVGEPLSGPDQPGARGGAAGHRWIRERRGSGGQHAPSRVGPDQVAAGVGEPQAAVACGSDARRFASAELQWDAGDAETGVDPEHAAGAVEREPDAGLAAGLRRAAFEPEEGHRFGRNRRVRCEPARQHHRRDGCGGDKPSQACGEERSCAPSPHTCRWAWTSGA
jgi:hypothetical protein